MPNNVLVTGGSGYIGSHIVLELIEANYVPIIVDNFVNSSADIVKQLELISGKKIKSYNIDLCNRDEVEKIFQENSFAAVIHLAGLKAVGESIDLPLLYYKTNIMCAINLLEAMDKYNVTKFIFSSSATVYGPPKYLPIDEKHPVGQDLTNPYGKTKYFIEEILHDLCTSDKNNKWSTITLRYFNPVGAHKSGMIGEDPVGVPNNLMPFVAKVASGELEELKVFGNKYNTLDGTGVRDYIHIIDLAKGHIAALNKLMSTSNFNQIYNLGTGKGYSVFEMVSAFEKASGKKIPYKLYSERLGDLAEIYGNCDLAKKELNWTATMNVDDMCIDAWKWMEYRKEKIGK